MFDKDPLSNDDPMGQVTVRLSQMRGQERSYFLQPMNGCKKPQGEIRMACTAPVQFTESSKQPEPESEPGSLNENENEQKEDLAAAVEAAGQGQQET